MSDKALLQIRLPRELKDFLRWYAKRKNKDMTEVVVEFIMDLKRRESDVPQI